MAAQPALAAPLGFSPWKMSFVVLVSVISLCSAQSPTPPRTCSTDEFACNSTSCVPMKWVCDGEDDCSDGSDENPDYCTSMTCKSNEFSCGPSSACIPLQWQCDGEEDCPNKQDEANCNATSCDADQFRCKDGNCITNRWVCDYENDCEDGFDEADCPARTCPVGNIPCGENGRCIPEQWKCDGDPDCQHGEDEEDCPVTEDDPSSPCTASEFMCLDRLACIHNAWKCDGDRDCADGSDEVNCQVTCRPGEFTCSSLHQCIPEAFYCDGVAHCRDSTDEEGCPEQPKCNSTQFDCFGTGKSCIDLSQVCDKHNDCSVAAAADETAEICNEVNPCNDNNGGCEQACVFTYRGHYHCECNPGYQLNSDNKTCSDVDECKEFGRCSQVCVNTPGSYMCKCSEGYTMDKQQHYCKADGDEPFLLFANRIDLREYRLHSGRFRPLIQDTKSAIALDYDFQHNVLFWSDVSKEQINMTFMNESNRQFIVTQNVRTPDGLAYDWVHNNLYWTDTGHNSISVVGIDFQGGPMQPKTLINTRLDEPRAIVVDPRPKKGWLYWSDWGEPAKIEKAGLHGGNRKTIVQSGVSTNHLEWPNGLTMDYTTNRLYWVDAKLRVIGTCNEHGGDQRIILSDSQHVQHPFAITVFEDMIYWSDWGQEAIHKVNKFKGGQVDTVMGSLYSPMDVHVFHKHRQPEGEDVCGFDRGGCSHLCLPVPFLSDNSAKYICACPDDPNPYKLDSDGLTCIQSLPKTTVRTVTDSDGKAHGGPETKDDGGHNAGKIAGIVVAVCLVLLLLLIAGGVVFYRSYTRKNVNSMNFDNPVYRKTTEDQFSLEKNQYQPSKNLPSSLEPLTADTQNEYV